MTVELVEDDAGRPIVKITEQYDDGPFVHSFDLPAVAAWRELLGLDDPVEVVEAILHVQLHGEPDPDPDTGRKAWDEPYGLLRLREYARENEAQRAREDHADHPTVIERANKAAYDAVHVPAKDGECALDKCRKNARQKLGLPDPAKAAGVETRTQRPIVGEDRRVQVAAILAEQADYLHECTKRFLHGLTNRAPDPLEDDQEANDD